MAKLALHGGDPVRTKPWPAWPDAREEDVQAVAAVIRSGRWWYDDGGETKSFEREFAAYHDAAFGVAVSSGTTALQVGLEALGVGPGDEVIVPAYTFQGTAASVLLANAVPVFADVDADTMNISPDSVLVAITDRTRAIIPVHLSGLPAVMDLLLDIARPRGIAILEDCAQAHGAVWGGRKVGSIGDAGAFSFQASKNLPSGEGGIVITNNKEVAARAGAVADCGRAAGRPFYEHHILGSNYRLTEMQGALLRARLRHLEAETELRHRNGRRLTERLSGIPGIAPLDPDPGPGDRRAYHLYPIRIVPGQLGGVSRQLFMQALHAEGIPCSAGYGAPLYGNPVFVTGAFRCGPVGGERAADSPGGPTACPVSCSFYGRPMDYRDCSCPVTEGLCQQVVWLFHNLLLGSDGDIDDIARAVEKVVENREGLAEA
jgi:dTDP-4-amino-4,6-dideoxygalactose transaminase